MPRSSSSASTGCGSRGAATKDFEELFACLTRRSVRALVVGGYAVAWRHRVRGPFGSQTVDYIGRADLIHNKQASARPRDLLDVVDLAPLD